VTVGPLCLSVLRDDETVLPDTAGLVRGNKARKFATLPTDRPLVSYGGAQSNAAAALAALAQRRGVRFEYYVHGSIPTHLAAAPVGNYAALLERGARIVELPRGGQGEGSYDALAAYGRGDRGAARPPFLPPDARVVPQGGACVHAEEGCRALAMEIDAAADEIVRTREGAPDTVALICAGTGASALFTARHLARARLFALPCAMPPDALRDELRALDARTGARGRLPRVLDAGASGAFRFGALHGAVIDAWRLARASGLALDLIYGAVGLAQLLAAHADGRLSVLAGDSSRPVELLLVHTGGLEGVPSQLARYVRRGLATPAELSVAREEADALFQTD
jgi:1-aminocyclopropane-1-carboxylate deaminase/D-cysteine desulfhydrase-like pyridoxal-dependent ACC family enzyme